MPLVHSFSTPEMRKHAARLVLRLSRERSLVFDELPNDLRDDVHSWIEETCARLEPWSASASFSNVVIRKLASGECVRPTKSDRELVSIVLTSSEIDGVTEATPNGFVRTKDQSGNVMKLPPLAWSWISPIADSGARFDIVMEPRR